MALYSAASLLNEVPPAYREHLPPLPRPAGHYEARTLAQLPAYIHGVCQGPDHPVIVVRFLSGRPKRRPLSIFRRPLYAPSSVYGGEVQMCPPPRALDLVGQQLVSSGLQEVEEDGGSGPWTEHPEMPRTLGSYLMGLGARGRTATRYDRMLYEEVLIAMATHRYSSAAYDQLGLYEVVAYDVDLEEEGHELCIWTSGWLFPINALLDEPDLGPSQGRAVRHYCIYGGQA